MTRPQGVRSFVNDTSVDQLVVDLSANPGGAMLYSLNFSWIGQTVGDRIVFSNSTDGVGVVAADKVFELILPTAAGTFAAALPSIGKLFHKGLWCNFQVSDQTAGKVKVDGGWDYKN